EAPTRADQKNLVIAFRSHWANPPAPWHLAGRGLRQLLQRVRSSSQVQRRRQLRRKLLLMAPKLTVPPEPDHLRRPDPQPLQVVDLLLARGGPGREHVRVLLVEVIEGTSAGDTMIMTTIAIATSRDAPDTGT